MAAFEDNYFEQGLRLLDGGDFDEAVAMFDRAIKLGLGDLAAIHVCRGEALAGLGRWEAAIESVNAALAIEPYLAAAYYERGLIRSQQGDFDLAINDYTMAIHIEPDFAEAYFSRALAYEERKRYAEAEADLTRALDLNPQELGAYEARGRVRAAHFNFDGAIADLSAYLRSGGGKQFDNHSETQGYLLILRAQRLLWRLIPKRGRGG
ncbi:MAG: tetratricopeptide repeat protein [Chloroflexi bacterium]|nr:tetratricopeptide repeat protein [Chloroflexota bacterium]